MSLGLIFLALECAACARASDLVTYLGGSNQDIAYHIAVDGAGNIFLRGATLSLDFPQTAAGVAMGGPTPQTCYLEGEFPYDCTESVSFIAKLNPSGSALHYSAYYGGPSQITGMIADAAGNLYLTGSTSAANFPTTNGAYETTTAQSPSGFVSKISPDASTLVFSTFVAGTPSAIALDAAGNIIVAGQMSAGAFVLKLTADGSHALFNQPLNAAMTVAGIALDPAGNVVIAGQGGNSPMIAKIDASGIPVLAAIPILTGLGATVNSICLDPNGSIYLAGSITGSANATYGKYSGGAGDAFVAKLENGGVNPVYFAYLGGDDYDIANSIAVDSAGRVYVAGTTLSRNFPVTANARQPYSAGGTCKDLDGSGGPEFFTCSDGFLVELNAAGTALLYSSYLGGSNADNLYAIALDSANRVYLAGSSSSSDVRTTSGVLQSNRVSGACSTLVASLGPRPNSLVFPCEDAVAARFDLTSPSGPLPRVTNAGSYATQAVAPGTLISLFGEALGPAAGIDAVPGGNGVIGTNLGSVQVLFNGTAAPVLYAQSKQVNAVVPYEIAGQSNAKVLVNYQGAQIDFGTWPVADAAPAIFSVDRSGQGQGAILNQDGTINSPDNPAARGSVISIFATGAGVTSPPSTDGQLARAPLAHPVASAAVWLGSANSAVQFLTSGQITYAGAAPTLVDGMLQVNVVVPADAASGPAVPVFLQIGTDQVSQTGVTLAIK